MGAFNDIRIPRVDDETHSAVKQQAKQNVRKIHQEALVLIREALAARKRKQRNEKKHHLSGAKRHAA